MKLVDCRALAVGMEKSGRAAAAFLAGRGARVTTTDLKPRDTPGFLLQSEELFDQAWDLIVLSPGVPADLPGLERARARGVEVMGEVELAAPYLRGRTIGITGSNGKTTTTSLVAHILRHAGVPMQLGGNIGTPVVAMIADSRPGQWNVLELSSFQLETTRTFRAEVAVCLNVTQNHLDRHYTFERYTEAKSQLFRHQQTGDFAVLNKNDSVCRQLAAVTPAQACWFSAEDVHEGRLFLDGKVLMELSDIPVPGMHNAENVLAAAHVARLAGVELPVIAEAVRSFQAVEHRLEFVAEIAGVRFYNDSKATSVDATIKALDSFAGNLWIILGGKDKGSDYTLLADRLQKKARGVLLIGAAAEIIAGQLAGKVATQRMETMQCALQAAWASARPGDTVLLAPACASYDQFQSYEHRGKVFKELVNGLQHGAAA